MEALKEFFKQTLNIMKGYEGEDNYHIRLAFYNQAYGAVAYEEYRRIIEGASKVGNEAATLWEEWKPEFEAVLWGE
jgi:hypothetical protein